MGSIFNSSLDVLVGRSAHCFVGPVPLVAAIAVGVAVAEVAPVLLLVYDAPCYHFEGEPKEISHQ